MRSGGLLAFSGGVIIAALAPALPAFPLAVTGLLLAVLSFLHLRHPAFQPQGRGRNAVLIGCCALLGAAWFLVQASWQQSTEWPAERAGEHVVLSGTVSGLPRQYGDTFRFDFSPDRSSWAELDAGPAPRRIQVSWFRPSVYLQPGQPLELGLRMTPPHGRLNVGGFDSRRHLLSRRVGALASVTEFDAASTGASGPPHWRAWPDRGRQYLAEVIQAESPGSRSAALQRALLIADRGGMDPALSETLRRTGTAHLLAISGLHVGMVAMIFGALGSLLAMPVSLVFPAIDRRRFGIVLALGGAAVYALMAGLTLPTQRALVMLAVGLGALLLRRPIRPAHALLVALSTLLLIDPLSPLASGFWLSFAAVAVLIWAFAWRAPGQRGSWWTGLIKAQLIVAVGMLPLNVGLFQQFIPMALPANLLAIPLVAMVILPSLLLSAFLIGLGLPADWPLAISGHALHWLIAALEWMSALPGAYRPMAGAGWLAIVLAMIGAVWLLAPPGWPARWLGLPLFLPLLLPPPLGRDSSVLDLHLLDMGDGQAILLSSGGDSLLVDTGPGDGEGGDAIGHALPALLRATGLPPPGAIILSNTTRRHAGGLGSLDDDLPRWSPLGTHGEACLAGQGHSLGEYRLRVLHPSAALPDLGNNSSCVLVIEGPGGRVLLPGTVDSVVERRLMLEQPDLQAEVLVLSRGGHRAATSAAMLDWLRPELALVSVPRYDRTGRPHPELNERLASRGILSYTTGQCGGLSLRLTPDQPPEIRSAAGQHRRFWLPHRECP
ncbi:MAG: DNA internalization-related competence protein ComEC/Rec2 [Wenzhouxiangella sp.]